MLHAPGSTISTSGVGRPLPLAKASFTTFSAADFARLTSSAVKCFVDAIFRINDVNSPLNTLAGGLSGLSELGLPPGRQAEGERATKEVQGDFRGGQEGISGHKRVEVVDKKGYKGCKGMSSIRASEWRGC